MLRRSFQAEQLHMQPTGLMELKYSADPAGEQELLTEYFWPRYPGQRRHYTIQGQRLSYQFE